MGTIQIDGSTPKITVGNATAEDASIVYDGNAKDFYIALDDSSDKLVIGEGSTVGTNSILTITDDSVTVGDAAAVDTKIVFDGNAQDYYVGLDDSADTLVLGLGSTLGTTPAITINSSQVATFAQNPVFPDGGVAVADLDIDGATDIGAAVVDADLFIIDDGAGGTNRKVTASRIKTYAGGAVTAINNATANELVTIGSTTTELDAESGLTYTDGALVIGGTTPSLTIGDAGAEDTKIVFDGNAQDFHIGLDDSADDLVIGLGSSLGTTTHMAFDETGAVTKPLQPAFSVYKGSAQNDISSEASVTVVFDSEIFDQNADFNTGTYTFTAPVTGKYLISLYLRLGSVDTDSAYIQPNINTSNRDFYITLDPNFSADLNYLSIGSTVLADMDANDTCIARVFQSGGTNNLTDIHHNEGQSIFQGHLVC